MNLFHLFSVAILAAGFSGLPAPERAETSLPALNKVEISRSAESAEIIPWNAESRLTWDDFLCEPQRGTEAVASTSTSLGIAYQVTNGKLSFNITCNFSKTKSWGLIKTDYILAHEQGHFDITEIFARKLYEALYEYEFNRKTFKKDINEIYQTVVRQKEAFQKMYDGETDHSRNRKSQYDWLEKIQDLLDATAVYANYP